MTAFSLLFILDNRAGGLYVHAVSVDMKNALRQCRPVWETGANGRKKEGEMRK